MSIQSRDACPSRYSHIPTTNREICGEYPVFLFDDVLSELDERRRKYILEGIGKRQIIITSCEADETVAFADNVIEVFGGSYVSSHR